MNNSNVCQYSFFSSCIFIVFATILIMTSTSKSTLLILSCSDEKTTSTCVRAQCFIVCLNYGEVSKVLKVTGFLSCPLRDYNFNLIFCYKVNASLHTVESDCLSLSTMVSEIIFSVLFLTGKISDILHF